MKYEKINMGAYNLHLIQTNKFKTITVEINFREKINKESITKRNLLKAVLLNTNKNFKKERELIKETENLYDLKLLSSNIRIGNYSNLSFKIRFLNEKYTEENMNNYSLSFLLDIIFNPDIENNSFKKESVDNCKIKIEKSIKSIKDNKLKYSLLQLLSTTNNKPYSYNSYGYIEDLEKINEQNLYEYYKQVLNDNYIDIFVVGDIDKDKIKELFKEKFKVNTFKKIKKDILIPELKIKSKPTISTEKDDANQTQLTMLYSLNRLTEFERKYVIQVYSELLGGSSNSILFDNVREKNSYAYYINSNAKPYDNIMMIYSGIEPGNSEAVIKLIKKTIQEVSKGNIDEELLKNSKETIISSIKNSSDSPNGIINTYYAKELVNSKNIEERIENINKTTKQNIINISKKIHLNTIYILEGDNNERD
ncbi:MAG: insulinase family protein [Bacilli bacterium]|nr:insulinase family protein [Bacilli bacterium]